jgi:hypothetical protein
LAIADLRFHTKGGGYQGSVSIKPIKYSPPKGTQP